MRIESLYGIGTSKASSLCDDGTSNASPFDEAGKRSEPVR